MAARVGGIALQLHDGVGAFLVDSVEECAERTLWLLQHPSRSTALAARGRKTVRERFLLTRLIADELRPYGALLGSIPTPVEQSFAPRRVRADSTTAAASPAARASASRVTPPHGPADC